MDASCDQNIKRNASHELKYMTFLMRHKNVNELRNKIKDRS